MRIVPNAKCQQVLVLILCLVIASKNVQVVQLRSNTVLTGIARYRVYI